MKQTITPTFLRRYEVLRRLYIAPRTIDELFSECSNMSKPQVITSLSNLLKNGAIRKEPIAEEPPKTIDEFFDENPKKNKKRTKHRYAILPAGMRKLAYWEWKWQLYTHWKCPWNDSFNENYYAEMTDIIKNDLRLPIA